MRCLLRDAERVGDLLPGPAERTGVADLCALDLVGKLAQHGDAAKAARWLLEREEGDKLLPRRQRHTVNLA